MLSLSVSGILLDFHPDALPSLSSMMLLTVNFMFIVYALLRTVFYWFSTFVVLSLCLPMLFLYSAIVCCLEHRDSKPVGLRDKLRCECRAALRSCVSGQNGHQVSLCRLHIHTACICQIKSFHLPKSPVLCIALYMLITFWRRTCVFVVCGVS